MRMKVTPQSKQYGTGHLRPTPVSFTLLYNGQDTGVRNTSYGYCNSHKNMLVKAGTHKAELFTFKKNF